MDSYLKQAVDLTMKKETEKLTKEQRKHLRYVPRPIVPGDFVYKLNWDWLTSENPEIWTRENVTLWIDGIFTTTNEMLMAHILTIDESQYITFLTSWQKLFIPFLWKPEYHYKIKWSSLDHSSIEAVSFAFTGYAIVLDSIPIYKGGKK